MKKIVIYFLLLLSLTTVLALTGCRTVNFTYVTNGGELIEASGINRIKDLPVPTKSGYNFSGWFAEEDLTGTPLTKLPKAETITVYAKWTLIEGTEGLVYELYDGKEESGFVIPDFSNIYNGFDTVFEENGEEEFEEEEFEELTEYRISGYEGSSATVFIPAEHEGLPVTAIKSSAFLYNNHITEVIITNGINKIGEKAFSSCISLKKVNLPEGLKHLPDNIFDSCFYLETVNFPNSLETIGHRAFNACRSITRAYLSENITEIGVYAFSGCKITEITMPSSITKIDNYAFNNCLKLKSVTILSENPPAIGIAPFNATPNDLIITVPQEALQKYDLLYNWSSYNIVSK